MQAHQDSVHVVVVTYTGRRFIEPCLRSIMTTEHPDFRVVVVDNGSDYGAEAVVQGSFPTVEVVRLEENSGFAGGANAGLRRALAAESTWIAILNDDTEILDPRWLRTATDHLRRDRRLGAVGFRMVEEGDDRSRVPDPGIRPTDFLDGFALVYRAETLRRVGLYDEAYFVYYDETDLQARMMAAGYRLGLVDTPIYHLGEGTTGAGGQGAFLEMRNSIRYSLKHRSFFRTLAKIIRIADIACNPWSLFVLPRNHGDRRMRGEGRALANLRTLCRALAWNAVHLPETLRMARAERAASGAVAGVPRRWTSRRPDRHRGPGRRALLRVAHGRSTPAAETCGHETSTVTPMNRPIGLA